MEYSEPRPGVPFHKKNMRRQRQSYSGFFCLHFMVIRVKYIYTLEW